MADGQKNDSTLLSMGAGVESQVAKILAPLLADTVFIYFLYKKYEWHVEGDDFFQYNQLFAKHARELLPLIELLGARIRVLGASAPILPPEVTATKTIDEPPDPRGDDEDMIQNLCTIHEHFIKSLRQAIDKTAKAKDVGTHELLISRVLQVHERQLLTVRSSLD